MASHAERRVSPWVDITILPSGAAATPELIKAARAIHHPHAAGRRTTRCTAFFKVFFKLLKFTHVEARRRLRVCRQRYIPWHTACAVVWELSRGLSSCRCGVNQETQSSIADFPNSLLTNKARVGFEAKNC